MAFTGPSKREAIRRFMKANPMFANLSESQVAELFQYAMENPNANDATRAVSQFIQTSPDLEGLTEKQINNTVGDMLQENAQEAGADQAQGGTEMGWTEDHQESARQATQDWQDNRDRIEANQRAYEAQQLAEKAQADANKLAQARLREQQAARADQMRQFLSGYANSQYMAGSSYAASLMGEENRGKALEETDMPKAEYERLVKQGGVLSKAQIAEAAAREAGQIKRGIESDEATTADRFARSGVFNPAAVRSASAGLRASGLGAGARAKSEMEMGNAQTLPGLLSGASSLGAHRAGLQSQVSWEQALARSPQIGKWATGQTTGYGNELIETRRRQDAEAAARAAKALKAQRKFIGSSQYRRT